MSVVSESETINLKHGCGACGDPITGRYVVGRWADFCMPCELLARRMGFSFDPGEPTAALMRAVDRYKASAGTPTPEDAARG